MNSNSLLSAKEIEAQKIIAELQFAETKRQLVKLSKKKNPLRNGGLLSLSIMLVISAFLLTFNYVERETGWSMIVIFSGSLLIDILHRFVNLCEDIRDVKEALEEKKKTPNKALQPATCVAEL